MKYTKNRDAFGKPLFDIQNTRFELAECATIARVAGVFVDDCVQRHLHGDLDATTASMAKAWVTDMQEQIIDRCVQLFGRLRVHEWSIRSPGCSSTRGRRRSMPARMK